MTADVEASAVTGCAASSEPPPHPCWPFFFELPSGTGYFSGKDVSLPGQIWRLDADSGAPALNVRAVHKPFAVYSAALTAAGLQWEAAHEMRTDIVPALQERYPAVAHALSDLPLHLAISAVKPDGERALLNVQPAMWANDSPPPASSYTLSVSPELAAAYVPVFARALAAGLPVDAFDVRDHIALPPPARDLFARLGLEVKTRVVDGAWNNGPGLALVDGFKVDDILAAAGVAVAAPAAVSELCSKLFYYILSCHVHGPVIVKRGRLFDVRDLGLSPTDKNVLFSLSK